MMGAVVGDIVGSRFEWRNYKGKDFQLFAPDCSFTDDTVLTVAIAKAVLQSRPSFEHLKENAVNNMVTMGKEHLDCGFGERFFYWLIDDPVPYQSMGNGSAMRVSAVAYAADSLEQALQMAETVTAVSHDHPEGIKGAKAVAGAVYLAIHGSSKEEIKAFTDKYYQINFHIDDIRENYVFDGTCPGSVPQALECFFEAKDFEDTIRTAVSIGGDSDTIAAMAGSIAEPFFGIPNNIRLQAFSYLDTEMARILNRFEEIYPSNTL